MSNTERGCSAWSVRFHPPLPNLHTRHRLARTHAHTHTGALSLLRPLLSRTQLTVSRWARVGFSHASLPRAHSVQYRARQQDVHTKAGIVWTQWATHWVTETHWSMDADTYTSSLLAFLNKHTHTQTRARTHTCRLRLFLRSRGL